MAAIDLFAVSASFMEFTFCTAYLFAYREAHAFSTGLRGRVVLPVLDELHGLCVGAVLAVDGVDGLRELRRRILVSSELRVVAVVGSITTMGVGGVIVRWGHGRGRGVVRLLVHIYRRRCLVAFPFQYGISIVGARRLVIDGDSPGGGCFLRVHLHQLKRRRIVGGTDVLDAATVVGAGIVVGWLEARRGDVR